MDKMSHNEDLLGNTNLKTPWHKSGLRNGHIGSLKLQNPRRTRVQAIISVIIILIFVMGNFFSYNCSTFHKTIRHACQWEHSLWVMVDGNPHHMVLKWRALCADFCTGSSRAVLKHDPQIYRIAAR